jgi:hypothetical protein
LHWFLQRLTRTVTMFGKRRGNRYTTKIYYKECTFNAVGLKNQSKALGEVIPKDAIKISISDCLSTMTEGRVESQLLDPIQE